IPLFFAVWVPPGFGAALEIPVDMLGLQELLQPLLAQFASQTTHLEAAKGSRIIIGQRVVDPQRTGLYLLKKSLDLARIVGVQIGSQPIWAIVRQRNRLVKRTVRHNWYGWPERFFAHNRHLVRDVGQYRWLVKIATRQLWWPSAARQNLRPLEL